MPVSYTHLPVYGKGENVRDWLYVEDHCKAIDLIIHKGRVGEVYNIGGHNEMKNIDIVKIICKELYKPESLITYVTDRKGHDMRYAIDPTKRHKDVFKRQTVRFIANVIIGIVRITTFIARSVLSFNSLFARSRCV